MLQAPRPRGREAAWRRHSSGGGSPPWSRFAATSPPWPPDGRASRA